MLFIERSIVQWLEILTNLYSSAISAILSIGKVFPLLKFDFLTILIEGTNLCLFVVLVHFSTIYANSSTLS